MGMSLDARDREDAVAADSPEKAPGVTRVMLWWIKNHGPLVLLLVALVVLWHGIVTVFGIPRYLVPTPASVLAAMVEQWSLLWSHSLITLTEVALGFFLSVLVGIPLAAVLVASRTVERLLYPLLVASQAVPKIALAPLFIVWVGFGTLPKTLMSFLISFFPVVIDTMVGLRSVPPEMVQLARSMETGAMRTFRKLRMPYALPNIFAGLRVAITLAVVGAVAAEFVGADQGLGYLLVVAQGQLNTSLLFAALILLSLMGIILFGIVSLAERFAVPWHVSRRNNP